MPQKAFTSDTPHAGDIDVLLPGPRAVAQQNNTGQDASLFVGERVHTANTITDEGQQSLFDSTWRSRTSLNTPFDIGRPPLSREMDSVRSLPTPSERLLAVSQRPEPSILGSHSAIGEVAVLSEGVLPHHTVTSASSSVRPPRTQVSRDWSQSFNAPPIDSNTPQGPTGSDELALWEDTPAVRAGPFAKAQAAPKGATQQAKVTLKLLQSIDAERKKNLTARLAIHTCSGAPPNHGTVCHRPRRRRLALPS